MKILKHWLVLGVLLLLSGTLKAADNFELIKTEYSFLAPDKQQFVLEFDKPVDQLLYRDILSKLKGANTIIFEFANTVARESYKSVYISKGAIVKAVTAQFQKNPDIARLVINLSVPLEYKVLLEKNQVRIVLPYVASAEAETVKASTPAPAAGPAPAPVKKPTPVTVRLEPDVEKEATAESAAARKPVVRPKPLPIEEKSGTGQAAATRTGQKVTEDKKTPLVAKPAAPIDTRTEPLPGVYSSDLWPSVSPDIRAKLARRVFFNFKKASIQTVIQAFARETGVNIIADENITGDITASFQNVPALEAFDAILTTKGYNWYQEGSVLFVTKDSPIKIFTVTYVKANDDLRSKLMGVCGAGTTITLDQSNNLIMVKGRPNDFRRIAEALKKLDRRPKQVVVDAKIVQRDINKDTRFGVQATKIQQGAGMDITMATVGMMPAVSGANPGFYVSALDSNLGIALAGGGTFAGTNYNVLASPKILAMNDQEAEIVIGSQLGYKVTTTTNNVTETSVQFMDVGTMLRFTPHISDDNKFITLDVHPEVSEGKIDATGLPSKTTTQTTVRVMVRDGQSVVIGGLIKEFQNKVESGVPFFSSLPIIGAFFRNSVAVTEKKELLIFLTPRIIDVDKMPDETQEIRDAKGKQQKSFREKSGIF